jgi:hypothetical protein
MLPVAAVIVGLLGTWSPRASAQGTTALPFQEGFENANLASRGWYDISGAPLSTAEKFAGASSIECRFTVGATGCSGGRPGRILFAPSDSVYLSFYIKHSTNWVGSGRSYHPHMFYFMTNLDGAYIGPAYTHLTAYVEATNGIPIMALQDGQNIDETRIGQNLVGVTENRAVAGCNGDSDGYGNSACYVSGSVHWNGKQWPAGAVYFDSTPGSARYKGDWHLVEAYFKLNSIVNGIGVQDGIMRYWYDGALIMDRPNVVMRTGANPTMKFNQFLVSPWIGDGSPADQRYWVDNLMISTARPASPPPPPGGGSVPPPAAPTNLRIIP